MLRVTIDLLPYGDEQHRRTLTRCDIINDNKHPFAHEYGNYDVIFYDMEGMEVTRTRVLNHPRQGSPWGILEQAFEKMKGTYICP